MLGSIHTLHVVVPVATVFTELLLVGVRPGHSEARERGSEIRSGQSVPNVELPTSPISPLYSWSPGYLDYSHHPPHPPPPQSTFNAILISSFVHYLDILSASSFS